MSWADGPAALLGDAHLRVEDPETGAFVRFLDTLPGDIAILAILGDLFSTWIGRPELVRPHHLEVVDALRRLHRRGCRLLYVEGNHDFFLRRIYTPDPFDRCDQECLDLVLAGRRAHLAHGDLMNRRDHQYRAWRAISKNRLVFGAFNLIPLRRRNRLVDDLERGMANTNLKARGGFPVAECLAYARPRVRLGTENLVFGHFHEERWIAIEEGERRGTVYVLPAWRAGHRYLRLDPGAEPVFVSA